MLVENILGNLPCGCIVFDADGKITFVNSAMCDMVGSTADQILNSTLEEILTISSRIFYQTHFFPMLKLQGGINEVFLTLRSKNGTAIPVLVNVKASQQNGAGDYVGVFTTVWERQKFEQELILAKKEYEKAYQENEVLIQLQTSLELNQQQLDRKISQLQERSDEYVQMGKVLTHDMQEPIRKISFFFQVLLEKENIRLSSDDLIKIDIIHRSVSRLRNLTSVLFDFVNLDSTSEIFSYLDVGELIRQAESEVKRSLCFDDFKVLISDLPGFYGKATQIKRVFEELFKNAIQNRDLQRQLIIQVRGVVIQENFYQVHSTKYHYVNHVQIEFCDNGVGFDSQHSTYVFGLLNKLNKNSDGVGIGLTLCRQIIANHYGKIKVSSNPAEGTTFTIVLPHNQI